MRIGYCRVSTDDQNLASQTEALKRARCDRIVKEVISGKSEKRSVLDKIVASLKAGDSLVVWRIDRLGRTFFHLVELEERLHRAGIRVISMTQGVDTSTKPGRMSYRVLAIFADEEHAGIVSRTNEGLATAKAAGKRFGRKPKLSPSKLKTAIRQLDAGMPVEIVARRHGVCRSTIYRCRSRLDAGR